MYPIKYKTTQWIFLIIMLAFFACKDDFPTSERFSWTHSGEKLAVFTYNSNELLLVNIKNDQVSNISVLDSCDEKKTFLYAPVWSFDDQYLLYAKANLNLGQFQILVYSVAEDKIRTVGQIPVPGKKELSNILLPTWSPVSDEIAWIDWTQSSKLIYVSAVNEKNPRVIGHIRAKLSGIKWSPDGKSIAYAVYESGDAGLNGLWHVSKNGGSPVQIFNTEQVSGWSWHPNGHFIALNRTWQKTISIHNNVPQLEPAHEILILDSTNTKTWAFELKEPAASPLFWSANGEKLAFLSKEKEDVNNVWILDVPRENATKMSFNNAVELFGWADANDLCYTLKYPDKLVPQKAADEEMFGILEFIKGQVKSNHLMQAKQYQPEKIGENVYGFSHANHSARNAWFLRAEPDILSTNYGPIIQMSDDVLIFLARTDEEHLVAADWYYLKHENQLALQHLQKISPVQFSGEKNVEEINWDSLKQENAIDDFYKNDIESGTLLRAILNLRQLKQSQKAQLLFNQYAQGWHWFLENRNESKDDLESFFWNALRIYGKYGEFEAALKDFSALSKKNSSDSLFVGYAYWTQAMLAFESGHKKQALDLIESAIHTLPDSERIDNDFVNMVSMLLINSTMRLRGEYSYLIELLIKNLKIEDEKTSEFYQAIGDYYSAIGELLKATHAYQIAATKEFDQYEIWDKLFELESQ